MPSSSSSSNSDDDEEYNIPLQDKRVFGAGLKRKRVAFVPASSSSNTSPETALSRSGEGVAERYLSLVLPPSASSSAKTPAKISRPRLVASESGDQQRRMANRGGDLDKDLAIRKIETEKEEAGEEGGDTQPVPEDETAVEIDICRICNLPISSPLTTTTSTSSSDPQNPLHPHHEATIPHQISIPHSHPPSSLVRSRLGLKILERQGWDPDGRVGLGRDGEGRRGIVKVKERVGRLGVGVVVPRGVLSGGMEGGKDRRGDGNGNGDRKGGREKEREKKKLGAKAIRKIVEREKREDARLRDGWYGNGEVERYLGK